MEETQDGKVQISLVIEQKTLNKINDLVTETGSTNGAQVVVDSINVVKDLKDKIRKGAKIIIENADGSRQLVTL